MTELTPRYEGAKTGADLTGTTGTTGRTFTLSFSNYYSMIEILVQGAPQHEGVDYGVSGGVITFNNVIFNDYVISIRYFTSDSVTIVTAGYAYATTSDVYRTAGITSTEVSTTDVTNQIVEAETIICRMTKNIYWKINLNAQTITSVANTSLTQTGAGWTVNDYAGQYVWIYSGTGSNQVRKILSNTVDTLTVDTWATNPDTNSLFKIFYVPVDFNPIIYDSYDGNNMTHMLLPYYPIKYLESLVVNGITVSPANVYVYEKVGKIHMKSAAETGVFTNVYPQDIVVKYAYGVDHLPYDIKRFVELTAGIQCLNQLLYSKAGSASNVTLPELSVTNPQAYAVALKTIEGLMREKELLLKNLKVWPIFG